MSVKNVLIETKLEVLEELKKEIEARIEILKGLQDKE